MPTACSSRYSPPPLLASHGIVTLCRTAVLPTPKTSSYTRESTCRGLEFVVETRAVAFSLSLARCKSPLEEQIGFLHGPSGSMLWRPRQANSRAMPMTSASQSAASQIAQKYRAWCNFVCSLGRCPPVTRVVRGSTSLGCSRQG